MSAGQDCVGHPQVLEDLFGGVLMCIGNTGFIDRFYFILKTFLEKNLSLEQRLKLR